MDMLSAMQNQMMGTLQASRQANATPSTGINLSQEERTALIEKLASRGTHKDVTMSDLPPEVAEKIKDKAHEFEAFFISSMLRPMFEGISTDAPFGGGHAEAMWRDMLIDEYGKTITKAGGIGLADQIQRELLRTQEAMSNGTQ